MPRVMSPQAQIGVYTYGLKGDASTVPNAQYVIDVAGIRDPSSNRGYRLKYKNGTAKEILDYVAEDPRVAAIIHNVKLIAHSELRSGAARSPGWLSFALRDHHGIWIAPAVGELVTDALDRLGYAVALYHYEITFKEGKERINS